MTALLSRLYGAILFLAQAAAILCCTAISVLTAYDVVLRNVFNRPLLGVGEINQALLAILLAFGFIICVQNREHIRVTLFEGLLLRVLPARYYRAWILGWEFLATWMFAALIWRHAQHALANYEYTAVLDMSVGAIFVAVASLLTCAAVLFTLALPRFWRGDWR